MNKKAITLLALKKDTKLPVILNRGELKELFRTKTSNYFNSYLLSWIKRSRGNKLKNK